MMASGFAESLTTLSLKMPDGINIPRIESLEFRGEIGKGGFGTVWHFYDPNVGRDVAVKRFAITCDAKTAARVRTK